MYSLWPSRSVYISSTKDVYKNFHSSTIPYPPKLETPQMPINSGMNGTSLVVQWLRIHLPMQGTQVQALVREDPTCRGATKPVRHNY